MIAPVTRDGFSFETGPNAILLSDTPIQKGSFANLAEFPLLQMFYKQGTLIPGHPSNKGRRPLLIGLGDQVRAQADYFFRGNYGLASEEEIRACGVPEETARELFRIKKWFAFEHIRATTELVETRALDAEAVELAPGVIVHRRGFNQYEFLAMGESVTVDLTLGPGEEYIPSFELPVSQVRRERFSVIHVGEGDGWDPERPCMGSIVCHEGLLYLVDAGPYITVTLEALGIRAEDIEGIVHSHAHDDHFAGLTSLVRSARRIKYFAAPCVRATAQKKMAALMRFEEERFSRFFDVQDLKPGEWNDINGMGVRPVYSPHPVETTVFFFRARSGEENRFYSHLADIPSFDVLDGLVKGRGGGSAFSQASRDAFQNDVCAAVDLKKIDVGGGLIHGNAGDFVADRSRRIILSHGIQAVPPELAGIAAMVSFGDVDVLFPGGTDEYLRRSARSSLASWFPEVTAAELEPLASCPIREIPAGAEVRTRKSRDSDVLLILSGVAEETDNGSGARGRLTAGALVGVSPMHPGQQAASTCRALSAITALSIPGATYRAVVGRTEVSQALQLAARKRAFLSMSPLFAGIRSETVLNGIAVAMKERRIGPGKGTPRSAVPELYLLSEGEVDLVVGPRLVETIGPGGFWGEERIVSLAPAICQARAGVACTCYAIPASILTAIPVVQWELQETFERRLQSFRAGFRFEWSDAFRVGVEKLDTEHRRLFALVNDLSETIGRTGKIEGHEKQKKELLQFTRVHFQHEESLLEKHGYPRLELQRKDHHDLLERLERFAGAEERRARPRAQTAVDYLKDWLIRHTLIEDLKYRDFFEERGIR
jgi:hemerythrin